MPSVPGEPRKSKTVSKKLKYFTSDILGKGGFGCVYKGEFDGTEVAVKQILLSSDEKSIKAELSLVHFGREIWHEHLARYLHKEEDEHFLYVVVELCMGTLEDVVRKKISVPHPNEEILRQITDGVQFLHAKQIVHRDIKPKNIFISDGGNIKLADFGLSKMKTEDATSFSTSGSICTKDWAAPELLAGDKKFKFAVDIFSLGCVFCYVLTNGKHPFGEPLERAMNITKGEAKKEVLDSMEDEELQRLTKKMISFQPVFRPSLDVIQVKLLECLLKIYVASDLYDGKGRDFIKTIDRITKIGKASEHVTDWARESLLISVCKGVNQHNETCLEKVIESSRILKIDVNSTDRENRNALTALLENSTVNAVSVIRLTKLLFANGIANKVNEKTAANGDTALALAIFYFGVRRQEKGLPDLLKLLLESGANPNVCNNDGWSPVNLACRYYQKDDLIDVLRLFIDYKAVFDRRAACGNNALTLVARYYQQSNVADVMRILIEEGGADVHCKVNETGWNALLVLINHYEGDDKAFNTAVKLLLLKGIDSKEIVPLLLELMMQNTRETYLAIVRFVRKSSDVMKIVRDSGAIANVSDKDGDTPLHDACGYYDRDNLSDVIRLLVECGAKVHAANNNGWTPLHFACWNYKGGNVSDVIRVLVECGAKVDAANNNGNTPLHDACRYYDRDNLSDVIRLLVECGAKVHAANNNGWTPLHFACWNYKGGNVSDVIRVLIECGAKVDAANNNGGTPLHLACANYNRDNLSDVIRVLVECGAKVDAADIEGWTPLHVARARNLSNEIIQLLTTAGAKLL